MSTSQGEQYRIVARTFAARLVEGETSQASIAQVQFLIWTIALLTVPLLRVPLGAWRLYMWVANRTPDVVDLATYGHKLFFLGYTLFVVGLLTLVIWDGIFPDRRDAWTFGTLPVRTRIVIAGRLTALVSVVLLVVLGFNLPALILYSGAAGMYYGGYGIPRHALAHLTSTLALAVTMFSLVILAQTIVLNVLSARWSARVTVLLQVALVVAILEGVFSFPAAAGRARAIVAGAPAAFADVPLWFLGLYEWIAGTARPVWGSLALRAVTFCVATTGTALLAYGLTYRRLCQRALQASELAGGNRGAWPIASSPRTAVRSFALMTLLRSRRHRLLLAVYFGVGLALVLPEVLRAATESHVSLPPVRALAMPLILIFFAVVGVRVVFAIPQEIGANWLFQLTETEDRDSYLSGAGEALWLVGVVPIVFAITPLLWHGWGMRAALVHGAICLALGTLLAEALIAPMKKIPFACTYQPGRGNVRKWWPLYLTAFTTFSFTTARIAQAAIENASIAVLFLALVLGGWGALRIWRHRLASRAGGFTYEEEPEDLVVTIDLAHAGR